MTFDPDFSSQPAPRRSLLQRLRARLPVGAGTGVAGWRPRVSLPPRRLARIGLGVLIALLLYYPIGMIWIHEIDDNPDFAGTTSAPAQSRMVATMAALIDREIDQHRWTPNDPFFIPSWALDNMPNYQLGIMAGLSRIAVELTDHIGRSRGTSQADPDLDKAVGFLKYPGDRWVWDIKVSIWPQQPAEAQYRAGRKALLAYNDRLTTGQAIFERRSDNLMAALERIASDVGSMSAVIEQHVKSDGGNVFDMKVDNIFYNNKGRAYAYYLVLRDLGKDYESVIKERNLTAVWNQMVDSFREAALLHPSVVFNGNADSQFLPAHLVGQGFYLLRARFQLYEVINILQK
jgi:hypothetical protein